MFVDREQLGITNDIPAGYFGLQPMDGFPGQSLLVQVRPGMNYTIAAEK